MSDWVKDDSGLSIRDIEKSQPYRFEPHSFKPSKKIPWLICKHCGLLTLRNGLTEWAVKVGCNSKDHPEYSSRCRNSKPK